MSSQKIKKKNICSICFEKSTNSIRCGHFFHKKCIKGWEQYNSCPVCRAPIDESKPVQKFDAYEEDTTNDEHFAHQLLGYMVDEYNRDDFLMHDRMFPENNLSFFLLQHIHSQLLGYMVDEYNRDDFLMHDRMFPGDNLSFFLLQHIHSQPNTIFANNENVATCENCRVGLGMDHEYISCPQCNHFFYCSEICAQNHEHGCSSRHQQNIVPCELMCENCGNFPEHCDESCFN